MSPRLLAIARMFSKSDMDVTSTQMWGSSFGYTYVRFLLISHKNKAKICTNELPYHSEYLVRLYSREMSLKCEEQKMEVIMQF